MSAKIWSLFLLMAILLSACQPAATPQPTVQPLRVQLTPLLAESWLPKLNACSEYLTQSNLLIEVRETSELDLQSADLIIHTSADLEAEHEGTYWAQSVWRSWLTPRIQSFRSAKKRQ